jgi:hypothetical protein
MTDRKLLEQALDAMLDAMQVSGGISDKSFDAVKALQERLAQPEPDPLINPTTCTWTHDDDEGSWDAECGERWSITEGTPEENNFRFCPGCGRTVKTIFVTPRK